MDKILFLCDGEKTDCKRSYCYKKNDTKDFDCCRHTSDVTHAIHFRPNRTGKIYVEEPQSGTVAQDIKE